MVQKLNEWLDILRSIGGVHFAECLNPAPPSGAARLHLAVYGDAALEGEGEAGLGGYAHGLYWQLYIYGRWKQLPISVLEFVALIGNVLVFEPIVIGRAMATFYTDSKNCFDVLLNSKSRAKLMQMAHEYLLKLPAYQRLKTRAAIEHVYGPANPAADAVSRGKMEFFLELCKQLGVQPRQLEVPIEVKHLLDQLCARYEELAGDVRPKDKAVRFGEASHPGPKRSAVRVHVTAQPPVAVTAPPAEGSTSVEAASVERPPPRPGGRPSSARLRPTASATTSGKWQRGNDGQRTHARHGSATNALPRDASEVAALHAEQLCDVLRADPSPLALRPADDAELLMLCRSVLTTAEVSHSEATRAKDDMAWKRWTAYCKTMRTPTIRDETFETNVALHRRREAMLMTGFLLLQANHSTAIEKAQESKPQSAMNMVHGVVRVHKRLGIDLRPGPLVTRTLTALCRQYIEEHGPEALLPARKEPMDAGMVRAILRLPNGTKCGHLRVDWSKPPSSLQSKPCLQRCSPPGSARRKRRYQTLRRSTAADCGVRRSPGGSAASMSRIQRMNSCSSSPTETIAS